MIDLKPLDILHPQLYSNDASLAFALTRQQTVQFTCNPHGYTDNAQFREALLAAEAVIRVYTFYVGDEDIDNLMQTGLDLRLAEVAAALFVIDDIYPGLFPDDGGYPNRLHALLDQIAPTFRLQDRSELREKLAVRVQNLHDAALSSAS